MCVYQKICIFIAWTNMQIGCFFIETAMKSYNVENANEFNEKLKHNSIPCLSKKKMYRFGVYKRDRYARYAISHLSSAYKHWIFIRIHLTTRQRNIESNAVQPLTTNIKNNIYHVQFHFTTKFVDSLNFRLLNDFLNDR